uniref:SMB domain-containing protein n=1 Tax=Anolis carolinensis TaxID=28377 RepID=H9G5L5_ANOCA
MILDVSSCEGRCGEGYNRQHGCQCDSNCLLYAECCPDYQTICVEDLSCKGRCTAHFVRGKPCDCDPDCNTFGKCCPDFEEPKPKPLKKKKKQKKVSHEVMEGRKNLIWIYIPDEMNLCNRKAADGIVPLRNGSLAVFRGHYYWLLNGTTPPTPSPRRITEVWGIPSPIDTVFSRCNCDGKTFFFKDSQYWRFTNDVMDVGYPKLIIKGFGGLSGRITGALSVANHKNRPESVYFFKKGGNLQQYTYKQEGPKKCKKKIVSVKYPIYKPKPVIRRRRRFERAVRPHFIRSVRVQHYPVVQINTQPTGILQPEVKVTTYWRGFPKEVNSVISIPNYQKPDGYDYYAFSKDQYYSVDVGSRIARPVTLQTGQTVSNAWYKCPAE